MGQVHLVVLHLLYHLKYLEALGDQVGHEVQEILYEKNNKTRRMSIKQTFRDKEHVLNLESINT